MKKHTAVHTDHRYHKMPVKLENPLNQDIWYCFDLNEVRSVDGVEYISVFKMNTPSRTHLMRKSALRRLG